MRLKAGQGSRGGAELAEKGRSNGKPTGHLMVNGCRRRKVRERPLSPRAPRLRVKSLLHRYGRGQCPDAPNTRPHGQRHFLAAIISHGSFAIYPLGVACRASSNALPRRPATTTGSRRSAPPGPFSGASQGSSMDRPGNGLGSLHLAGTGTQHPLPWVHRPTFAGKVPEGVRPPVRPH